MPRTSKIDQTAEASPAEDLKGVAMPELTVMPQSLPATKYEWVMVGLILAIGIVLRFTALSMKPLHNDEGVNAFFLYDLFVHNKYAYDPHNYHGPSIYYLTLPLIYLFGVSVATMRALTDIFSLLTVWLLYRLRSRIGGRAALYAALLYCVSPGSVFFARYFIHEALVACFTLGVAMSAWDYYDKREPRSVFLCALSAGLLFATKETAAIECAILGLSALAMAIWLRIIGRGPSVSEPASVKLPAKDPVRWSIAATIFLGVNFVLYSSMFTHYRGVSDALHSPLYWFKRTGDEQVHPWSQFLIWLAHGDPVLLTLGICGAIFVLIRRESRFSVFAAFWTLGTIIAYSLSGYKTPWLVLNMLVPMAIVGGQLLAAIPDKMLRTAVVTICAWLCVWESITMNFYHYDDDSTPYVYAQTSRGFFGLLNAIDAYSAAHNDGGQTAIEIVSPDYWPLPWYLRHDAKKTAYWGKIMPPSNDTSLIVASDSQVTTGQVQTILGNQFTLQGKYALRPGVILDLYQRVGQ